MEVSRGTSAVLDGYVTALLAENRRQNLISAATEGEIWDRHIRDSAQLLSFAQRDFESWVDVGSGAGLPGLVVAILSGKSTTLVEPRAKRVEFLRQMVVDLGLANVRVVAGSAAAVHDTFDVVSARAVAPLDRLFGLTLHLAHDGTRFVFPKGRAANSELEVANRTWQGDIRLEPSQTSDEASIVVAEHVRRRGQDDLRRDRQPKGRRR